MCLLISLQNRLQIFGQMCQKSSLFAGERRHLLGKHDAAGENAVLVEIYAELAAAGVIGRHQKRFFFILKLPVLWIQFFRAGGFKTDGRINQVVKGGVLIYDRGMRQQRKIGRLYKNRIPENRKAAVQHGGKIVTLPEKILQLFIPAVIAVENFLNFIEQINHRGGVGNADQVGGVKHAEKVRVLVKKNKCIFGKRLPGKRFRQGLADTDMTSRPRVLRTEKYRPAQSQGGRERGRLRGRNKNIQVFYNDLSTQQHEKSFQFHQMMPRLAPFP